MFFAAIDGYWWLFDGLLMANVVNPCKSNIKIGWEMDHLLLIISHFPGSAPLEVGEPNELVRAVSSYSPHNQP